MNKEQIIDEVYENYSKEYEKDNSIGMCLLYKRLDGKKTYRKPDKEMFVGLCNHDKTFSEKWGLKIEERELSLEERFELFKKQNNGSHPEDIEIMDDYDIPTKLITLTYNNETIESYE
jgi:hypothetical protein